jgi:hypothetical protein
MKTILVIITTIIVTLVLIMGICFLLWMKLLPLHYLLATTSVNRVEINNRTLRLVVQDIVGQVEAQRKGIKLRVIFSPEMLAENKREISGGVFGNPPVEGTADQALYIVALDYHCHCSYVGDNTILFYYIQGD